MDELKGKRICMVADDSFEDSELMYPLYRLKFEAGADVVLAGVKKGAQLTGKYGLPATTDAAIKELDANDFDMLVIPGGQSPDHLRVHPEAVKLAQDFDRKGKPIASICHGAQLLITARLLKGKRATGWKSIRVDMEDAGATYEDRPLVVDGNYIFSRQPSDLGYFCDAIIRMLTAKAGASAAGMAKA